MKSLGATTTVFVFLGYRKTGRFERFPSRTVKRVAERGGRANGTTKRKRTDGPCRSDSVNNENGRAGWAVYGQKVNSDAPGRLVVKGNGRGVETRDNGTNLPDGRRDLSLYIAFVKL